MTRLKVPVQLRWSDMDAYGHINNVEMFRLLEEARIAAFWAHPSPAVGGDWPTAVLDAGPGAKTTTLVARQEIEYVKPLAYRRTPVVVELWIGYLGGASIDVCYEVHDAPEPEVAQTRAVDADADADADAVAVAAAAAAEPASVVPYARACTTLVLVDATTGSLRRITEAERASWAPYLGPAVEIRRRGSR